MFRMRAAVVLLALVSLSACADDDADPAGTSAATDPPAPPAAPATTGPASTAATTAPPVTTVRSAAATAASGPATTAKAPPTTTVPSASAPTTAPASLGDPTVTFTQVGTQRPDLLDIVAAPVGGLYQVFQDGTVMLTTAEGEDVGVALDITDLTEGGGEQGLLGLAIHPQQPLAYVNYTDTSGDTVVAEYEVGDDGVFDGASARVVLGIDQPYANHNGGGLGFGPDRFLYIATGDGGSAGDPERRSLDLGEHLGKLLRIDPVAAGDQPYTVPEDNPFVGDDAARPEIWSYGLRNPWRFAFDEATGDLWIADVGQGDIEEIDVARAEGDGLNAGRGVSFGWSAFEGTARYNNDQPADGHEPPIYEYQHTDGRCSVSGGAPYRGDGIPGLAGGFVFGDFCTGEVWAVAMDGSGTLVDLGTVPNLSAVRIVGADVYALSLSTGLFRLDPA